MVEARIAKVVFLSCEGKSGVDERENNLYLIIFLPLLSVKATFVSQWRYLEKLAKIFPHAWNLLTLGNRKCGVLWCRLLYQMVILAHYVDRPCAWVIHWGLTSGTEKLGSTPLLLINNNNNDDDKQQYWLCIIWMHVYEAISLTWHEIWNCFLLLNNTSFPPDHIARWLFLDWQGQTQNWTPLN